LIAVANNMNDRFSDRTDGQKNLNSRLADPPINHRRLGMETQFWTRFGTLLHNALQDPDRGVEWMRQAQDAAPPGQASKELRRITASAEAGDGWERDLSDLCREVFTE
jgi:hypothetical protein